jgi:hypothetical protein
MLVLVVQQVGALMLLVMASTIEVAFQEVVEVELASLL